MRVKPLVFISAKHAAQNSFEERLNSTQAAAGLLSMPQKVMTQWCYWKIAHLLRESEQKFVALLAVHILDMSLKVKVMQFQLINVGVSTQ